MTGVEDDDEPLSPSWRDEIERRIQDALSGRSGPGLDWRVAMIEIRRKVEQKRAE